MNLILFLLLSSSFIGGVEIIKRKFTLSTNITRRVVHLGSALIAVFAPLFLSREVIIWTCLFFSVLLFFGRRTSFLSSVHDVERKSFGDVFLPLGEAISAAIFLPNSIHAFQ